MLARSRTPSRATRGVSEVGTLRREIDQRSIHLCIDMQRLFASGGPWETPWMPRVLPTSGAGIDIVSRPHDRLRSCSRDRNSAYGTCHDLSLRKRCAWTSHIDVQSPARNCAVASCTAIVRDRRAEFTVCCGSFRALAVALACDSGFLSVSPTLRMVGRNLGLSHFRLIIEILIPAAFPQFSPVSRSGGPSHGAH